MESKTKIVGYQILNGYTPGKPMTTAQRTSGLFAEEPVVMGKVLRRRGPAMNITPEQYELNKLQLYRLEKAGAIRIIAVEEELPEKPTKADTKPVEETPKAEELTKKPEAIVETAQVEVAPAEEPEVEKKPTKKNKKKGEVDEGL